jgi:hypothetical protein
VEAAVAAAPSSRIPKSQSPSPGRWRSMTYDADS